MAIPIAVIAQIAGKGLNMFGEYQEAKVEAANLEYEAYIAQQDAEVISQAGKIERHKQVTASRKLLARQIAIAAASGRDIGGGSPLAIIESSQRAAALDEKIIAYNTERGIGIKLGQAALLYGTAKAIKKAAKLKLFAGTAGGAAKFGQHFKGGKDAGGEGMAGAKSAAGKAAGRAAAGATAGVTKSIGTTGV